MTIVIFITYKHLCYAYNPRICSKKEIPIFNKIKSWFRKKEGISEVVEGALERKLIPITCLNLIRPAINIHAYENNFDFNLEISQVKDEVVFYKRPLVPYEAYSISWDIFELPPKEALKKVIEITGLPALEWKE